MLTVPDPLPMLESLLWVLTSSVRSRVGTYQGPKDYVNIRIIAKPLGVRSNPALPPALGASPKCLVRSVLEVLQQAVSAIP